MTPERAAFLAKMGAILARHSENIQVNDDGTVEGVGGHWVPWVITMNWDALLAALRLIGMDASTFEFQVYDVVAANPFHGGAINLQFPPVLVVNSPTYQGEHDFNLVQRNPYTAAVEIKTLASMRKTPEDN